MQYYQYDNALVILFLDEENQENIDRSDVALLKL